jgi:hypothetical protein
MASDRLAGKPKKRLSTEFHQVGANPERFSTGEIGNLFPNGYVSSIIAAVVNILPFESSIPIL